MCVSVSGTSCTTTSRRRANDVSQTHTLTSLKADMKLGRSWQAQADHRQRGECGFPKLRGSMFCILGPAEGFTGHKSTFARLGIIYSSGRGPFDLGCRRTLHQQSLSRSTPLSHASLSEDSVYRRLSQKHLCACSRWPAECLGGFPRAPCPARPQPLSKHAGGRRLSKHLLARSTNLSIFQRVTAERHTHNNNH